MCRLLAVCTHTPSPLSASLPSALTDFRALSRKHKDGWGIAWRDSQAIQLRLDTHAAWESDLYPEWADEAVSDQTMVHLRRASVGLPVVVTNCHPFVEGEVAFEHNGQFPVSDRLLAWCEEHDVRPRRGTTDSELYFGLILHHAQTMSWPDAIRAAADQITEDMRIDDPADAPESLNCLLSTPDAMYAFAQSNPERRGPDATPDTYDLRLLRGRDEVVISSTQWTLPGTTVIPQRYVVQVERGTLKVTTHPAVTVSADAEGAA